MFHIDIKCPTIPSRGASDVEWENYQMELTLWADIQRTFTAVMMLLGGLGLVAFFAAICFSVWSL